MKYQRFEDLPVWRDGIELGQQIYAPPRTRPSKTVTACATKSSARQSLFRTTLQKGLSGEQIRSF
jgi:hypothetical protein